jgi:hypothetical protein
LSRCSERDGRGKGNSKEIADRGHDNELQEGEDALDDLPHRWRIKIEIDKETAGRPAIDDGVAQQGGNALVEAAARAVRQCQAL